MMHLITETGFTLGWDAQSALAGCPVPTGAVQQ